MKAICTNASNKPPEIPNKNWLVAGKEYTITEVIPISNNNTNDVGVKLAEVSLDELFNQGITEYSVYRLGRFKVDRDKFIEFINNQNARLNEKDKETKQDIDQLLTKILTND